jgi:hypothetical protein
MVLEGHNFYKHLTKKTYMALSTLERDITTTL